MVEISGGGTPGRSDEADAPHAAQPADTQPLTDNVDAVTPRATVGPEAIGQEADTNVRTAPGISSQAGSGELSQVAADDAIVADTESKNVDSTGVDHRETTGSEMDGWVELEPGIWVERGNAVWGEHDWREVPVSAPPDDPGEPPPLWEEGCRSWIDDVPAPELGPVS